MTDIKPIKKRISILRDDEINLLYSRPELTEEEQSYFFALNTPKEEALLTRDASLAGKLHSLIALGYFRCKQQFFQFNLADVENDVAYLMQRYFPQMSRDNLEIGREAKLLNQQLILSLTGHKLYNREKHANLLLNKAEALCRLSVDPVFLFWELWLFISHQKLTRPGYSTLQKIISQALVNEKKRIAQIFSAHLSIDDTEKIFTLFEQKESFYAITALKKDPKNFKLKAVRKESAQYAEYEPLHDIALRLLPQLGLSKKAILYYASLVDHYTVRGLQRTDMNQTCLWLLCFIQQRYQKMLDNLVTMFIHIAKNYEAEVAEKAKLLFLSYVLEPTEKKLKTAQLLRNYTSKTMNTEQSFEKIRQDAYENILPAERIDEIVNELEDTTHMEKLLKEFDWPAVDELVKSYKLRLRTLLKVLPIEGKQYQSLQKACQFLQEKFNANPALSNKTDEKFPLQFIAPKNKAFIYDNNKKTINENRYEYECYRQLAQHLHGYALFVTGSHHYCSLESQLYPDWEKSKASLIAKLDKPLLSMPFSQFIDGVAKSVDDKIIAVNEAIISGDNPYVKIKEQKDGSKIWTLPYTKKSLDLNNPLYAKLPPVNIFQALRFANQQPDFMPCFTHIKPHYAKSKQDELAIYTCLLARGTGLGLIKMADLCDFPLHALTTADNNYLRLSTLRAANNRLAKAISALPIFVEWNLHPDLLHGSLDGIKLATRYETILSRFSAKYFGLDKGVTAYFMIVNHFATNGLIHGSNEHESHYVFDLVYNNDSEIQPDILSTDTEGANQLTYILLHLIEKLYAPRYRSLTHKTASLVSYSDPNKFKDYIIKPQKQFDEKLILSEEDNVKHIMVSLLMGEINQSQMIAKLSSGKVTNNTKRALWDMNAILMTDHLLNFISDLDYRQAI